MTIAVISLVLIAGVRLLADENDKLKARNFALKDPSQQTNILFLSLTSRWHVRIVTTLLLLLVTDIMLLILLVAQIKVVTLGYTKYYKPPEKFTKKRKELRSGWLTSVKFRLRNFLTMLVGSQQQNEKMYFKYQREHYGAGKKLTADEEVTIYPGDRNCLSKSIV